MLGNFNARPTLGVRDLAKARAFYEGKLGLAVLHDGVEGTVVYKTGSGELFVYVSQFAGTNQATALSWNAGSQLDTTVAELRGKGVVFEHYDLPGMHREGDIHVAGTMRIAWFQDPDGNIHAIGSDG